ncbi:phage tail protein [Insolitispirillum peregrinum]|uniref:hypothetical protein n=1 Tax=Insolitispirillum peregrinum TaxID=80876 RepID=UPI00360E3A87
MTQRMFIPSFAGGELSPAMYGRVDLSKYAIGLRRCRNFLVHRTGGVSNRAGFRFLGTVADEDVVPTLIPFRFNTSADQVAILEFGNYTMRIWYQGALITDDTDAVLVVTTPYTAAEAAVMGRVQSGDVMYLAHPDHPPQKLSRTAWDEWSFDELDFVPKFELPTTGNTAWRLTKVRQPDGVTGMTPSARGGVITMQTTGSYVVPVAGWETADVGRIVKYMDSGEIFITAVSEDRITATGTVLGILPSTNRAGYEQWSVWAYQVSGSATAWSASLSGSTHSYTETITYKITAISEETGEESLPSDPVSILGPTSDDWPVGTKIKLVGPASGDTVAYYRIYKEQNGMYGYVGLAAEGEFTDDNLTPDISDGPPDARNPFADEGDYPALVTIHQQRLCFAATTNTPNGVWMSRTGFFENFSVATPTKDDDAITFAIGSGEINAVRGLVSVNDLIILTAGSENVCTGGNTGSALTPTSVTVRPQSYWGGGDLPPLVSGNRALFIQGLGSAVRDLGYEYSVDGFKGNDLSVMARHLLDGYSIVSWAYAQVPDSTFWLVRSDGALLSLTYFNEQELQAWALHTTPNGSFERVAVIEGEDRHELYAVVRRTVDGVERRFIERLARRRLDTISDAVFLDSHLTYTGSAISSISGLDHLEGATVGIMADGTVLDDQVVSGGAITLPRGFSQVVVGLRYDTDSVIETLDIDLGAVQGLGSVQGRKKSLTGATIRLEQSREFYAGPDDGHLTLTKAAPSVYDAPPDLFTGDVSLMIPPTWSKTGRIVLKPAGPVPLTVLAIAPDLTIGG